MIDGRWLASPSNYSNHYRGTAAAASTPTPQRLLEEESATNSSCISKPARRRSCGGQEPSTTHPQKSSKRSSTRQYLSLSLCLGVSNKSTLFILHVVGHMYLDLGIALSPPCPAQLLLQLFVAQLRALRGGSSHLVHILLCTSIRLSVYLSACLFSWEQWNKTVPGEHTLLLLLHVLCR